jgi:hypothetical protein
MNRTKRGQAAIEFLVTYGWAIMAAILVIGALSYFGMTNPATSLPDKCIFSNAFECYDYKLNTTTLSLQLINTQGESVYGVPNISASISDGVACIVAGNTAILEPEGKMNITCNNLPDAPYDTKEKIKLKIIVNYSITPLGYTHVSLGELYTTVQ